MKNNRCKKGFTLIELLVVVLIIGILAAIALPQYQKATERSKATEALVVLKSVANASAAYYLQTGNFPTNFDELPVTIPWTGNYSGWGANANIKDTRSNADWSLQIFNRLSDNQNQRSIFLIRLRGKYKGGLISWHFTHKDKVREGKISCWERRNQTSGAVFNGNVGDYCQKVLRGKPMDIDATSFVLFD